MLTQLSIQNFRNLKDLKLEFLTPVTAFVGANAQGKTNLLEAIHVLSLGRSLRAEREENLINYDADFFRLAGMIRNNEREERFEVAALKTPRFTQYLARGVTNFTELKKSKSAGQAKQLKINGQKLLASEYLGHLPTVLFVPEDLNLLLLAPALRRRYLDVLLATVDRAYLRALSAYTKALKHRNALLLRIAEGMSREDELEFWDGELSQHGTTLGRSRTEWLTSATNLIADFFQKISGTEKVLGIQLTNFHGENLTPEKYREHLTKLREKDLRYGTTNYGPHRADITFTLDGISVAESGSRGEVRSVVLALKFAELQFLEMRLDKKPILLLDDVFSELDRERQEHLLTLIQNHQTFITTTKVEHLEAIKKKVILEVSDGKLKKF